MFELIGLRHVDPHFDEEPDIELINDNEDNIRDNTGINSISNGGSQKINTSVSKKQRRINDNIIDRSQFASTLLKNKEKKDNKTGCC